MFQGFGKSKILVEINSDISKYIGFSKAESCLFSKGNNFLMQNQFSLHLEGENVSIEPNKIQGFTLNNEGGIRNFTVKSSLFIDEWIADFQKVHYGRLVLYDPNGNVVRFMEYDLNFVGYKVDWDYYSKSPVFPIFNYEIFD